MQIEAYTAMQQEAGSEHPNLTRLSHACRVISAVGDQDIKEAFMIEHQLRLQLRWKHMIEQREQS